MRIQVKAILIVTTFLLAGTLAPHWVYAEAIQVGFGKSEITPPSGTPLAGYGKRRGKPSTGVHDPIYSRAIALTKESQTFVLVSADLVLIDAKMRKEVLEKLQKQHALPAENFLLMATHTHSGSGAIGGRFWERFIMGKFKKKIFEQVRQGIVQAASQALQNQTNASAQYAETRIDSLIENRMDEKLNIPARLRVIRFKSENKILGTLVFMAAHPTLLPASHLELSADFPGVLTQTLETKDPNSVAIYMNGAAADLRPKTKPIEDRLDRMKDYGSSLAEKVNTLTFENLSLDGLWKGSIRKARLPKSRVRAGFVPIPSMVGGRVFPRHAQFQALRLGKVLFLGFPGEIGSEVGREIEREAQNKLFDPFILGYANDYVGYIVSRRHYLDKNQYESQASFYGEKMEWFIQKQVAELTDQLMTAEELSKAFPAGNLKWQEGIAVLKLRGNAYHVGYEEGRLLKENIREGYDDIFRYFRKELIVPLAGRIIINTLLDRAWKKMEPYISYREYSQLQGLSDGSGIPFRKIKRIHAMPEVYPTWCTNGAYWGDATQNQRLIAIRNLDWNRHIKVHEHAAVKKIEMPGQETYINIGYYGFTGLLSGLNEKGISVGQIGATSADESMEGLAMPFLLKRVLQDSSSLDEAIAIYKRNPLTRGYNYIVADAIRKKAVAIEATQNYLAIFRDYAPKESDISYALRVHNAVFRGDTALDPTIRDVQIASKGKPDIPGPEKPAGSAYEIRYLKHGNLVKKHYGKINPEIAQQMALEIAPGSNIQSVVYAYPEFFVANAKGDLRAAETDYVRFDLNEI